MSTIGGVCVPRWGRVLGVAVWLVVSGLVAVAAIWVVWLEFQKTDREVVQTVVDFVSSVPGPSFAEVGPTFLSRVLDSLVQFNTVKFSATYAVFFL